MVDGIPSLDDIVVAIEAAKTHGCDVQLNWKGPGYAWHGDRYSCIVSSDSDANEIFNALPKIYGL